MGNPLTSEQYWEPSPSYSQFLTLSSKFVKDNFAQLMSNYSFPRDTVKDLNHCLENLHQNDYVLMLTLSIFWTLTRSMLTHTFFKVITSPATGCPLSELYPTVLGLNCLLFLSPLPDTLICQSWRVINSLKVHGNSCFTSEHGLLLLI